MRGSSVGRDRFRPDLPPHRAEQVGEIADDQRDPDGPPDQRHPHPVAGGGGVGRGEAVGGIEGRPQPERVVARQGRGHHPEQERGRGEERGELAAAARGTGRPPRPRRSRARRRRSAQGRATRPAKTSGRTQAVAAVATTHRTSTAFQASRAKARLRSRTGPVVLQTRYRAPWPARATSVKRPTSPVYQSRMPGSRPGRKFVNSGMPGSPFCSERHAANEVAERRAEDDGQERRREREDRVPEFAPQGIVLMRSELDRHAAQDQQPEHDHQRQVEAAERGGVDPRERHEQARRPRRSARPRCRPRPGRSPPARSAAPRRSGRRSGARCRRRSRSRRARRRRRASPRRSRTRPLPWQCPNAPRPGRGRFP